MTQHKMSKAEAGTLGQLAARQTQIEQKTIRVGNYDKNPNLCKSCNIPLSYNKKRNTYCSHSCAATFNNSKYPKRKEEFQNSCIICDNLTHNKYYCSRSCRKRHTLEKFVNGLIHDRKTLKHILIEKYNNICQICNLTHWNKCIISLEIDHIDGDAGNNQPENIRLICPNCHSTTSTWKGRNRGNGRKSHGLAIN